MIGARETGRVWRDQLVCPECWDALNWPLPQAKQEDNLHALARAREEVAKNATRAGRVEYATPAAVRPGPSELDQATKVAQFIKVILGIAVSVVILGVVLRCAGIVGMRLNLKNQQLSCLLTGMNWKVSSSGISMPMALNLMKA